MVHSRFVRSFRSSSLLLHRPSALPWRSVLIGTLAGTLLYSPNLIPIAQAQTNPESSATIPERQATVKLGVIRSADNISYWQGIMARVEATGLPYEVIPLQQVRSPDDFGDVTILLLPNIETMSSNQLLYLQSWMARGGHIIVSGPTGNLSFYGVRQALRSLVGAYWETSLSQPALLEPVFSANHAWLRQGNNSDRVLGGVLVPVGLSSDTIVSWRDTAQLSAPQSDGSLNQHDGTAAVVVTRQSTYLGWQWGRDSMSSPEFDQIWLQAAIERFQDASPVAASTQTARRPGSSTPPARRSDAPAGAALVRPSPPSSVPTPPSSPSWTPRPGAAGTLQDPAEQVAPAGIEVDLSALPITTLEAIAMRQELENLIGRFESALLSANSVAATPSLRAVTPPNSAFAVNLPSPILTASANDGLPGGTADVNALTPAGQRVAEAREILKAFPDLVAQQEYAAARREWLRARQILWDNLPTDRPLAQPEIRAMWLDRGTIVQAGSRRGLAQIFDQLAAAGINTVFFETVNAGYPIYPSQVAPEQNPLTRQWDPLADAVELAHERGIEIHAWVWAFAAGNRAHNTIINRPADFPGPLIAAHPTWANYDNRGNMIPPGQGKPFLDPANPEVRRYLLRLFEEIVTRYDVDGLQLDYIRYPFQDPSAGRTYGYGLAARQQFQRQTGVDPVTISPSDRQLWQQWTDFRTEQINSFVAETSRTLRRRRPDLILSAAVFAMSEHERVQKIQQNWEVWARQGDVDLIVPMSYALDTNRLQRLAGPWLTEEVDLGSTLVIPGIRLLNLPEAAMFDQIQALRDMPAGGYALFAVADLNETLAAILQRTQGREQINLEDPIPYREPFAAAAIRYQSLQREWSYMLANGQLWIREQELEEWRTQAEALGEAFEQLAANPSQQQQQRTERLLQEFQGQFDRWMRLQSLNQGYRVRTWKHRLATLETLLNYGEQASR